MYKSIEKIILSIRFRFFFTIGCALTAIFNKNLNNYFIYAVAILFTIYLLLAICYYLKIAIEKRTWASKQKYAIIFEYVEHEWRIESNGDCYIRSTFMVKNIGNKKIKKIPFDNLGWLKPPKNIDISCEIIDTDGIKRRIKDAQTSIYQGYLSALSKDPVSFVAWSNIIDPPLNKNQNMKYILKIFTEKTEEDAFNDRGTFAGIPVNSPTEKAVLKFIAPAGYKFHLINELIVLDDAGDNCTEKYPDFQKPSLTSSGTMLNWELKKLVPGLRFAFQYKFDKD